MTRRVVCAAAVLLLGLGLTAEAAADAIQSIINQATLAEYKSYLRVLTGVDPVPTNPPAVLVNRDAAGPLNGVAGQWIRNQFAAAGLATTLQSFRVRTNVWQNNVIAEIPGTTRPDDVYVICAHYDTGPTDLRSPYQPGCDDNGSGTAAVMLAARILSQYQFEGTVRFVTFSGEEEGLIGSDAYARSAQTAGENIVAALNLDMILHPGFDNLPQNPDYDLDIGTNSSSYWLAQYLADKYNTYTPLDVEVNYDYSGGSDYASFWEYGFNAIDLSENSAEDIWGGSNSTYHSIYDTLDNPTFDWDFGLNAVRGGMAGLIGLAGLVPEPGTFGLLAVVALLATRRVRRGGSSFSAGRAPAVVGLWVAVTLAAPAAFAGTLYVDDDAALGGDGTTWPTAFRYLQDALAAALPGDEIHIAQGVYWPDQSETGLVAPGDRAAAFELASGVALYGGYRGCPGGDCGGAPDARDVASYESVFNGDLLDNDLIGSETARFDNSYSVVSATAVDGTARLDGVTILRAVATGLVLNNSSAIISNCTIRNNENIMDGGGGLSCFGGAPHLVACAVMGNVAAPARGGGINALDADLYIDQCTFTSNAAGDGGAIACSGGTLTMQDSTLQWNTGSQFGAGLYTLFTNTTLLHCTLAANWAYYLDWETYDVYGAGGAFVATGGQVTLTDCLLAGNMAAEAGGAACIYGDTAVTLLDTPIVGHWVTGGYFAGARAGAILCDSGYAALTLTRCTVSGNSANGSSYYGADAGAIDAEYDGVVTADATTFCGNQALTRGGVGRLIYANMVNCVFAGNAARYDAGVSIVYPMAESTFTNCTFTWNRATSNTGALRGAGQVNNCILWDNTPAELLEEDGVFNVSYSDVRGGWAGQGNLNVNPSLADGSSGAWTAAGSYDPATFRVTLTDAQANWTPDGLVGRFVNPRTSQRLSFVIVSNTATTLTVWADAQTIGQSGSWVPAGVTYAIFDARLASGSPCINAGSNYIAGLPATDLAGAPRVQQCRVDMGAYESPYAGAFQDCNNNGVSDDCDIYDGTSADANQNHIPDECETPPGCAGDLNGDGSVGFADINAFVLYLSNYPAWQAMYPACDPRNGDLNGDGEYGPGVFSDINAFVARLTQCGNGYRCE